MASRDLKVRRPPHGSILVVDDNRDTADTLAVLLAQRGYETWIAYDGQQALQLAAEHRPDAVLLDITLPVFDGYEVCRRLRSTPWGRNLCILAQTGWSQPGDRRLSAAAGFDGHLVKPVDFKALCHALEDCIETAVAQRPETKARGPR